MMCLSSRSSGERTDSSIKTSTSLALLGRTFVLCCALRESFAVLVSGFSGVLDAFACGLRAVEAALGAGLAGGGGWATVDTGGAVGRGGAAGAVGAVVGRGGAAGAAGAVGVFAAGVMGVFAAGVTGVFAVGAVGAVVGAVVTFEGCGGCLFVLGAGVL